MAEAAGISIDTLRSFESGRSKTLSATNQAALIEAFKTQGIQFLEDGDNAEGVGVALKR